MRDVAHRIGELLVGQWSTLPVGKLTRLVDPAFQNALDQIVIGDRVPNPQGHGSNLCIENRAGRMTNQAIEDFQVLTRRVEDLWASWIRDQLQERTNVQILSHRIDDDFIVFTRCLDQAELRPIRGFAMKLGINADESALRQTFACNVEIGLSGDGG